MRCLLSNAANDQDIIKFTDTVNTTIRGWHIEDKTEVARNIVALDGASQYSIRDVFYINTQSAGAIDVDIIDNTGDASTWGVIENIVYSGGSTTGKIKLRGTRIELALSNCQVSFNNTSSSVTARNLSNDLDTTNLTSWEQFGSGFSIGSQTVINTTGTEGFLQLPTMAGTPTGVPASYTGKVQAVFDTTGNKLWVYDGGWISVTLS